MPSAPHSASKPPCRLRFAIRVFTDAVGSKTSLGMAIEVRPLPLPLTFPLILLFFISHKINLDPQDNCETNVQVLVQYDLSQQS